ncbi:hypothetical protein CRG98_025824 [Punica granatum]|nr:hypothetical protein CRG98_025824 [Punica granatum]
MDTPHVLVIPYPAQGHVIPLMELSRKLAELRFRITFVNTEHNHDCIMRSDSIAAEGTRKDCGMNFMTVSDGLEEDDRKKPGKLSEAVLTVLPGKVKELICEIHPKDRIACVVADQSLGWAMEIAREKGLRCAAFCPAAAAMLVLALNTPRMIEEGIITDDGTPTGKHCSFELSPDMPPMNPETYVWARIRDKTLRKNVFQLILRNTKSVELADLIVCNSSHELETGAFKLASQILSIGPILASNWNGKDSIGSFWKRDLSCLDWLDRQPAGSVVYVAFGSFTVLDPVQSKELALGLELTNRPFLWVVRSEPSGASMSSYHPAGFAERVGDRGKMVWWAPQQRVLSHPAVGCFISHCGWNSIVEGLVNGVPFLCWPYFADQFLNQSYICDIWKVGLGLKGSESGTAVSREEIAGKVEELMEGGGGYKGRAIDLKRRLRDSVTEGGVSHGNFEKFVRWLNG